jgi:hypothetical protein
MIVLGVIAAVDALKRGVRIGPLDPSVSLAIPLLGITGFTILIFGAWRARRNGSAHKASCWQPSVWLRRHLAGFLGIRSGSRLQQALLPGPLCYSCSFLPVVLNGLAVPIGMTPPWHSFAAFLNGLHG